jgi:hypothetical protein
MSRVAQPQPAPNPSPATPCAIADTIEIDDGIVLIGSDPHWRPTSTATKAFIQLTSRFAEEGSLRAVIPGRRLARFRSNLTPRAARVGKGADRSRVSWRSSTSGLGQIIAVAGLGIPLCV